MPDLFKIGFSRTARDLILIAFVCGVLYGFGLGALEPKDEEPRRALVAREMIQTDTWLVPHLNGKPYLAKPPGFYWQVAFCSMLAGEVTETTARLPSALAVLAIALMLYGVGARQANPRTGLIAAMMAMTSGLFLEKGHMAEIDMNFTFWVSASLLSLFHAYETPSGAPSGPRWLLTYALLAAAFLVKGPPALLFFIAGAAALVLIHRSTVPLRSRSHCLGLTAFILPVAAWIWAVHDTVGLNELLQTAQTELVDRATGKSMLDRINIFHYPTVLLIAFLPWSPFLLLALPSLTATNADARTRLAKYSLISSMLAILLFSLAAGKHTRYLLPIVPLFALAAADFLDRWMAGEVSPSLSRYAHRSLAGLTTLLVAGAIVLAFYAKYDWNTTIATACIIAAAGAAITCVGASAAYRRHTTIALAAIVGAACLYRIAFVTAYAPASNERKSLTAIVDPINAVTHKDARVYTISWTNYPIFYQLDTPVWRLDTPQALTAQDPSDTPIHCFVTPEELTEIQALQPGHWQPTATFTHAKKEVLLISTTPPDHGEA